MANNLIQSIINLASRRLNILSLSRYSSFKDLTILPENSKLKYEKVYSVNELQDKLSPMQYYVTQEKGTERPWSGALETSCDDMFRSGKSQETGTYSCIVCDEDIFSGKNKFESGSGWPSFYDVISNDKVYLVEDKSLGMKRIEVQCKSCGAHMGHLFNDGPAPTKLRYCINAASLGFSFKDEPLKKETKN